MAGAVLRAAGSTTRCASGRLGSAARTAAAWSLPHTTQVRDEGQRGSMRKNVSR